MGKYYSGIAADNLISEKEYTKDSNHFVVPPSGSFFKVPGHINN